GEVSTKGEEPLFAMQLGMDGVKIGDTFKALELFESLAPVANILQGKLNSKVTLSGILQNDFTPNLQNINGNVVAELLATRISPERAELLNSLGSKLSFLSPDKLDLRGLKTALSFENGTVKVKPFTVNYDDIAIRVDGGHTFDKKLSYTATLDVPAKYLGEEVNNLIARIDEKELEQLSIPVIASIGGYYSDPEVSTDLSSGVRNLTAKLVEIQKQKLIDKGKVKAGELIGGILSSEEQDKDSTAGESKSKAGIKEVLGGVLTANSKKSDSVKRDSVNTEKDVVKDKASDIIGGLFKKKKKDTTTSKKDTILQQEQ
ncbi:MAG: AsmA-like C-terminal region-containing protein, partial [Eudoraea sp.]|nr:AsmA-like C-terminal region-containing protein [Eudoraea sp.]